MSVVRWTAGAVVVAGRITAIVVAAVVVRSLEAVEHSPARRARTAPAVPANIDLNLHGPAVARAARPRPR
jgi:hypothetical protein